MAFIAGGILLACMAVSMAAEDIGLVDIIRLDDAKPHVGHVRLGGQAIPFAFESTSKGNGTIVIANLDLRVMDSHDDGVVFNDRFLAVQVVDLDGKGLSGLLVTGAALRTGEQGPPPITAEPISCLYRWDGASGAFTAVAEIGKAYVRPGDAAIPQAAFQQALAAFSHASNASAFDTAKAALLTAVKSHPAVLAPHFQRFAPFYLGEAPQAGSDAADQVAAKAVMWAAGACGLAAKIAPLLVDKSPPCVVYAFAEARGVRLYYHLTEDAGLDQIVPPDHARGIVELRTVLNS